MLGGASAPVTSGSRVPGIALGLVVTALVVGALGVSVVAAGGARPHTAPVAVVTLCCGVAYVCAGTYALVIRPEKRTGSLMALAGFLLLASAMAQSDRALPFTLGNALAVVPIVVIAQLVLGFPDGRLHSRWERIAIGAAYVDATVIQVAMLSFMGFDDDPTCPCPSNLLLARDDTATHMWVMGSQRRLSTALAVWILVLVVLRWRRGSAPQRRATTPVLAAGGLCAVLLGLTLVDGGMPTTARVWVESASRIAFAVIPVAYLYGLVRARLDRSVVGSLMLDLQAMAAPGHLREALARALGDDSLQLVYWVPAAGSYVDADGVVVDLSKSDRDVSVVGRNGRRIAAIVHDPALGENRQLLDAVTAAAGMALENERLQAELRAQLAEVKQLAEEQTALQRVATSVARGVGESALLDLVVHEVQRLFAADVVEVVRAAWGDGIRTRDGEDGEGTGAPPVEERPGRATMSAPVTVDGRLWGLIRASRTGSQEPFAPRAHQQLATFASLLAQSVANAQARDRLRASRARIVGAGDRARLRLERNLHDGAQQRLVAVSVALGRAEELARRDDGAAAEAIASARHELSAALEELREIARGLHPPILNRGLPPALKSLAERSPIPVDLATEVPDSLPEQVVATVYYVVAEALTNAARYSGAAAARVDVGLHDRQVRVAVYDDGVGGARVTPGSGLEGLRDRVEALSGRFELVSAAGAGTRVCADLPLPD